MGNGVAATPTRGRGWLRAGYAGLLGFFILERVFRQPGDASTMKTSADDRGTTRLIVAAYSVATDLPLLLRRLRLGQLPSSVAPLGLIIESTGLAIRGISMQTLGASYTRTLRTEENEQALVQTGPYRLLRHPGYLGSLLTWIGFSFTSLSLPTVALVSGLLGAAYARRINAEEELLRRDLSDYEEYSSRTFRLIPFVW